MDWVSIRGLSRDVRCSLRDEANNGCVEHNAIVGEKEKFGKKKKNRDYIVGVESINHRMYNCRKVLQTKNNN